MSGQTWSKPAEVKARVWKRWERGEMLSAMVLEGGLYPLRVSIKGPSASEIAADFAAVQDWVSEWRRQGDYPCQWKAIAHRLFGQNEIPSAVCFADAQSVVKFLGVGREWAKFERMVEVTRERFPGLVGWLGRRSMVALSLAADWERILAVVKWVLEHPRSHCYLRQVDLPGIHTKFIEGHRGVIAELLDLVLPPEAIDFTARGLAGFNRRYGFRDRPERIRFRFLDPSCAVDFPGLDLSLDAQAFARLRPQVKKVFITENEINYLVFPDVPGSLMVFGSGYGWTALQDALWLHQCEVLYWGDIDTHGFAILDELRGVLPHVRSFLMDSPTFDALRDFCCTEPDPSKRKLQRLTDAEFALFSRLRADPSCPRLEQERVPFSMLQAVLG